MIKTINKAKFKYKLLTIGLLPRFILRSPRLNQLIKYLQISSGGAMLWAASSPVAHARNHPASLKMIRDASSGTNGK
ncbi:hypothetical protein DMB90_16230 [Raoultella planticola]|uniref:Uncharacterized protein n=1 Tax=Raoultella planticola TaxID=575 RepID=A0A5P6AAM0_RAOPL|nr:hypothetical protein DMB90_16230 [Raoultella planticola]